MKQSNTKMCLRALAAPDAPVPRIEICISYPFAEKPYTIRNGEERRGKAGNGAQKTPSSRYMVTAWIKSMV